MKRGRRVLTVIVGLTGGIVIGAADPILGPAWGGIYGAVAGAFVGKMIFG